MFVLVIIVSIFGIFNVLTDNIYGTNDLLSWDGEVVILPYGMMSKN